MQNLKVINCHSRVKTVTGRIEDIPRRKIQPTIMLNVPIRQKKALVAAWSGIDNPVCEALRPMRIRKCHRHLDLSFTLAEASDMRS